MFKDRIEAGEKLCTLLGKYKKNSIVIALLRGGLLTALPVAKLLKCHFYLLVIRKLGVPSNPELGFGAIDPDGNIILNKELVTQFTLTQSEIQIIAKNELTVLRQRIQAYGHEPQNLNGKTVIVIDDGLATGFSMLAAIGYVKTHGAKKVVVAIPYAHYEAVEMLKKEADEVLCLEISHDMLFAVGSVYKDFHQVNDEEIKYFIEKEKIV